MVVEVLETAIESHRHLAHAVDYFRDMGCLIAIDDFGAGHSNVDRIWRLRPDIVKLDRSLIADASNNLQARQILPGLVNLLHEAGALVLAEGIESHAEAMLALEADCDLVQGYYFGMPAASLVPTDEPNPLFEALWQDFSAAMQREIEHNQQQMSLYTSGMLKAAARISDGEPLDLAGQGFMALPAAIRLFMLDGQGHQSGSFMLNELANENPLRFAPLNNVEGAVWSRRHYFRLAMKRFGELQVSRPYLSIAGELACVTLSIGLMIDGKPHVLCGDLHWLGHLAFDEKPTSVIDSGS